MLKVNRRINRHEETCVGCPDKIQVNDCLSWLGMFCSHKKCESYLIDRYELYLEKNREAQTKRRKHGE